MILVSFICLAAQPAPSPERQEIAQEIAMTKCSRDGEDTCRLNCSPICSDEDAAEESNDRDNFVPEETQKPRKSAARRVVEGD